MANISWTSSSINSYFKTSLGNKSTVFDGIYSAIGDAKMIKSGCYGKLMKSYYTELEKQSSSEKSENSDKTDKTDKKKKKSDVLDQLLSKDFQKTKVSNTYLDDLLSKNKTYNSDGKKNTAETTSKVDEKV